MAVLGVQNISISRLNNASFPASYFGFFLCMRGSARIIAGTRTYHVRPGFLCLYTPNLFLQVLESSRDLDGICKAASMEIYSVAASLMSVRDQLSLRSNPCVLLDQQQTRGILELDRLVDERMEAAKDQEIVGEKNEDLVRALDSRQLSNLLMALCAQILRAYFLASPLESIPMSRADMVFNRFLQDAYQARGTRRQVSYYAGLQYLSPYYFSQLVRSSTGRTVMDWISEVTMFFAHALLDDRSLTISQVSEKLEFADQSVFARYFRALDGLSPSEYRRRNR